MNKKNKNKESFIDVIERNMKEVPGFGALIKLLLFGLFFLFFILVVKFGNNNKVVANKKNTTSTTNEVTTTAKSETTYKDYLDDVYKTNKHITASITLLDKVYKLDMNNINGILTGTIESLNGTSKFKIENNEVYEIKMDEEINNPNILNGISLEYIIPANLINLLESNKSIKVLEDEGTVYTYELENKNIKVILKDDKITSIEINEENNSYIFTIE